MLRSTAKKYFKKALLCSSILRLAGRFVPTSAVILSYHSIVEDPRTTEQILGISQARATFDAHMDIVARDFSPVTVEDVAEFAKSGKRLPARAVAVTFDDGFADNHSIALPILGRYGIPATFYIMVNAVEKGMLPWYCRLRAAFNTTKKATWNEAEAKRTFALGSPAERKAALIAAWERGARMTGSVQLEFIARVEKELETDPGDSQRGFMMNWEQVRALKKAGHTVGAHTLSHPNCAQVSEDEARTEIAGSKGRIENEIGAPIDHFSYPHPALNPQWSRTTLDITREAGFKSAALTACGPVRAGDEPLALKRIYAANDLDQFVWNLQCTFLGKTV